MLDLVLSFLFAYFLPGYFVSLFFSGKEITKLERLVMSFAFSFALMGLLMTLFGVLGTFSVEKIVFAELALMLVIGIYKRGRLMEGLNWLKSLASCNCFSCVRKSGKAKETCPIGCCNLPMFSKVLILAISFVLFMCFYQAVALPETSWDGVAYHLPYAKLFNDIRTIPIEDPLNIGYMGLPHGMHLFSTWFYMANGFNDVFARLLSPVFGLMSVLLVYAFVRRFADQNIALLSAFFLSLVPLFIAHSMITYVNLPEAFFCAFAMFMVWAGIKSKNSKFIFFGGLLAGAAMLIKYSAIMVVPAALAVIIWFGRKDLKNAVKLSVIFLFAMALMGSIWFARNAAVYGNPVYPYFGGIFGRGMTEDSNMLSVATFAPTFFLDPQITYNWGVGPMFLAFGIVGILAFRKRDDFWKMMLIWLIVSYLVVMAGLRIQARFFMFTIFAGVFFTALGFDYLAKRYRLATYLLLFVMICYSFSLATIGYKIPDNESAGGIQLTLPFFVTYDEAMQAKFGPLLGAWEILSNTPKDAVVMSQYTRSYYYMRKTYPMADTCANATTMDACFAELKDKKIDYILTENRLEGVYGMNYAAINTTLTQNLNNTEYFMVLYENDWVHLYQVRWLQ